MTALSLKIENPAVDDINSDLAVDAIDQYLKGKSRFRLIVFLHVLIIGTCGWFFVKQGFTTEIGLILILNIIFVFIALGRKKKSLVRLLALIDMTGLIELTSEERALKSNLEALKARIVHAEAVQVKTQIRGGDEKGPTWGKTETK